jgi:phosphoenolpyruvate carboxykinase (ATP)
MLEQGIRNPAYGADKFGLGAVRTVYWNLLAPELYEFAIARGEAEIVAGRALCAETGVHTGRSPKDKYIVLDDMTRDSVWWDNNGQMSQKQFQVLLDDFIAHNLRAGSARRRG